MEDRKRDHIDLAFSSRTNSTQVDTRFEYEPLLSSHDYKDISEEFAGMKLELPLWISSMTGGTKRAAIINSNLAKAANEFGCGMGLGSCRTLLDSSDHFKDFDIRGLMPDQPLYANIGICQLEHLLETKEVEKLKQLVHQLKADGLVVHINPMQEAFQPEGDRLKRPSIEILKEYLDQTDLNIIVKEVGQGFGKESLRLLLQLPLTAIEFGAFGGTNFSLVELNRSDAFSAEVFNPFIHIGHSAEEMVHCINQLVDELPKEQIQVKQLIISGGISSVIDGYYLTSISKMPAIFGMGSALLRHAMGNYDKLQSVMEKIRQALHLAHNFLRVKHT